MTQIDEVADELRRRRVAEAEEIERLREIVAEKQGDIYRLEAEIQGWKHKVRQRDEELEDIKAKIAEALQP